jgi:predicted dehydrogenase
LKDYISDGRLGDIYYAKALAVRRRGVPTWGVFIDEEMQGGGPLIDIGTHALDLTLWLMDNYRWESVMGSSYKKLNQKENAANPWGPWDPKKFTVEDSAFGFIKFENGATIILESSWALNTLHSGAGRYILCGTEGGADFDDGLRINGEKYSRLYTMKPELQSGGVDFYEGKSDSPPLLEAQRFIDAVVNDKQTFVLPEQAAVVTQILEAIYESARTGKAVYNSLL